MRGCILRNTRDIYGIVVYAGPDSKVLQNSTKSLYKVSALDLQTNIAVIVILCLQFVLACVMAAYGTYQQSNEITNIYIGEMTQKAYDEFVKNNKQID